MGGSLSPQAEDPEAVGRKGSTKGILRPSLPEENGEAEPLRRLLHFPEHENKEPLSDPVRRSIRPRVRITAFWPASGAASHYYSYIRDGILGPIVIRVDTFLPFHTTYYLNGHSYIEGQLKKKQIAYRKDDNAFPAVADPAALQAAHVDGGSTDRWPDWLASTSWCWTISPGPRSKTANGVTSWNSATTPMSAAP